MKVVYTNEALRDLDEILTYIAANYPTAYAPFEKRLHTAVARIGAWPESAAEVIQRPGVRVVPLVRYPYKMFYHATQDTVEILHIYHAARQEPSEDDR
jgi:toxin ParE1/3/4